LARDSRRGTPSAGSQDDDESQVSAVLGRSRDHGDDRLVFSKSIFLDSETNPLPAVVAMAVVARILR